MEKTNFLPEKYKDLAGSKPVERASQQKIRETGKGPQSKEDRIQTYLDRLERLVIDPEKKQKREMFGNEQRPHALVKHLREMIMRKYVRPNKEKMAEGAARVEERAAREMGIEAHYGEEELAERGEIAVEDLEKSLDNWISYLSDANEPYPIWFRYYAFRNVLDLGDYDKDKGEFTKRSQGSTRLFPDIDRGALAYVQQMIEASKDMAMLERLQKAQRAAAGGDIPQDQLITKEKATNFAKISFAKQYAEGIGQAGEITPEMRQETRGTWVKYQKGTDPTALWASLQNKGTAWCTKGFATAEKQLEGGDFYVYYTFDRQGKPAIPRVAIRMQGDSVGEVRGVADNDQNLEGNMAEIAEGKMRELPGSERYKKASADMKQLTAIEKKIKKDDNLTQDDLIFLYEIKSPIAYFGYHKDPRIKEVRDRRDPIQDMPIVFGCASEQIAHTVSEIHDDTKAYVGLLEPGIFDRLQNIDNIYTEFPDGRITQKEVARHPELKTSKDYTRELDKRGHRISDWGKDILGKMPNEPGESLKLVILSVADLGLTSGGTTDEIYAQAKKMGLELCPAWAGPELRLDYDDQPMDEWVFIGMKQIADASGRPSVFCVGRGADGAWLSASDAHPGGRWHSDFRFAFAMPRKPARTTE